MNTTIKEEGKFKYLETGTADQPVLLLLHGLFGALSNFQGIIEHFGNTYNVVVPLLPIFELPREEVNLESYVKHVDDFVEYKGYEKVNVLGNSLGGHITLLYVLHRQERISSATLTGSSGLFESAMGDTYPKRGDYDYIKNKTELTFYDPKTATKELVDEVFDIVNDREKAIRIILTAKSAIRHNLEDRLKEITVPVLLIWGKNDTITPPFVGEKFNEGIEKSQLFFVDKCGHAPMMERSEEFNTILEKFLKEVNDKVEA